jgi:hypothetical protein
VSLFAADPELRQTLKDENALGEEWWVYNDITDALADAKRENKPLFVTFRCIPCKDCKAFDAEVAQGSEVIEKLAREKFIPVRQVEMEGVDLSQFQFDYDLNWAAMFINADGTVYARYGTQSAEGPDAYNSIEGLQNTMLRVLELHEHYPENAAELAGKRGEDKPYETAIEMPGLRNPERYAAATTRENCIHCHNIHDAENQAAFDAGEFTRDRFWRYPLPDQIGLIIDPESGVDVKEVVEDSAASQAGIAAGETVTHINGQAIVSIADMQWVLDDLPNTDTEVNVTVSDSGEHTLQLAAGWKEHDFSWRGSMWSMPPKFNVWMPELDDGRQKELGIPADETPFEVRWINVDEPGGRAARDSGLREGDIIVEVDGQRLSGMNSPQFAMYIKLHYQPGEKLPLTVLRDGREVALKIDLPE